MRLRPVFAALTLALAGSAVTLAGTGRSAAAASVAPTAQAWWYLANTGSPPPPPPGVNPHDLFVAGSKGDQSLPSAAGAGVSSPFSDVGDKGGATAIAAVRYAVPAGQAVDRLVLRFDGSSQSSVSMAACRITGSGNFKAETEGPWADVPAYDCTVPSVASLTPDGTAVQFTDVGALANGSVLSVVVVAQYAAYDILLPPGPDSLMLRTAPSPYTAGSPAPVTQPGGGTGGTGTNGNGGASPGSGASLTAPAGPARSGGTSYVPPSSFSGPAVAAAPPATAPAAPGGPPAAAPPRVPAAAAQPAVALPASDDGRARVASAVGLGAVLAAFAWLIAGDLPRLRRLLAGRLAGPGVSLPEPVTARGVGRFRRERSGRPPEI